jgi:hypothetical protein
MKIPDFTLDRHGVWTKDEKEEHNQKFHATNKDVAGIDKGQDDAIGKNKGVLSNFHSSHLYSNVIIITNHIITNSQGFLVHPLIMFSFSLTIRTN